MKTPRFFLPLLSLVLPLTYSAGQIISSDRLPPAGTWAAAGVPGGIPTTRSNLINVTQAPYNADKTGATNAAPAIQAAINAAHANDIVYLPAGTYRCDATIYLNQNRNNITLRGDVDGTGTPTSIIDGRAGTGISVGVGSDYSWNYPSSSNTIDPRTITKGQTTFTIASTPSFTVGRMARVAIGNGGDALVPAIHVTGYDYSRHWLSKVVAKTATTVTLALGAMEDYTSAPYAKINACQLETDGVGLENLVVTGYNSSGMIYGIEFEQCYGCWIYNVKVTYVTNYPIFLYDSLNCEVRHSWCDGSTKTFNSTNGAGILVNGVTASLVVDNVVIHNYPGFEINFGTTGCVFAYNFLWDSNGKGIDSNHGPHNSLNLYEGNVMCAIQCDGYFGGADRDMVFRNWLNGIYPKSAGHFTVALNRFTRMYNLVGNILGASGDGRTYDGVSLGNPNLGNGNYSGTAQPSVGRWWADWTRAIQNLTGLSQTAKAVSVGSSIFVPGDAHDPSLPPAVLVVGGTTRENIVSYIDATHIAVDTSNSFSNASFHIWPGPGGFQELDLDVAATLLRVGNFNYFNNAIPAAEALGAQVLPASLFLDGKPAWFGSLTWPAFDPTHPNPTNEAIPAGYRFAHGTEVPGLGIVFPPSNAKTQIQVK